jgi:hydrogenase expression/formation protein HypE
MQQPVLEAFSSCPVAHGKYDHVLLGHGSGGRLSADLLRDVFLPALGNKTLSRLEDAATVQVDTPRMAFTTDSFVIRPLFFPGGDIGKLAVCGTINDLAVTGAKPLYMAAAFILEEGLPLSDLTQIVRSMREACDQAGVALVTGDTKVVDRGKGDKVFITTTGLGSVADHVRLSIHSAKPGDAVIVSGTIGDHGMAVMSVREGLEFETELKSDCAALHELTQLMLDQCPNIRCMRDPTRGGLASALNELAKASSVGVQIRETQMPVRPEVHAACEILGLDPLYVANEGKLVAVVPPSEAEAVVAVMRTHPLGRDAAIIGEVVTDHPRLVTLKSIVGGQRVVPMLTGEQLPRIC